MYVETVQTPLGWLGIRASDTGLVAVDFDASPVAAASGNGLTARCKQQLQDYFAGTRRQFDLPLAAPGTDFQRRVWQALMTIPFGTTCAYQDIASRIGNPRAVRAVGSANGCNPLAILVPCHRVIGRDGGLTGYTGGLARKEWLLRHEGALLV